MKLNESAESATKCIFDTDIGSDVDDLQALVCLVRDPRIELLGITTVYGDTVLRSRIAKLACSILGHPEVDVVPGQSQPLSQKAIWLSGDEGNGYEDLDLVSAPVHPNDAVAYLVETARRLPGRLDILACGPLTNIACALSNDQQFASNIRTVYIMGGYYTGSRVEHNFACDGEAASTVFQSGLNIVACGLETTSRVWLGEEELLQVESANSAVAKLVATQTRRWWKTRQYPVLGDSPHDAVAALCMTRPELYEYILADVDVMRAGPSAGKVKSLKSETGSRTIVSNLNVPLVEGTIVELLCS